jgi:multiple sugar transport system substrate-binding protein
VASMVAGTPPDVWNIGQGVFTEYAFKGEALVLDSLLARDKWVDFADFEPTSMYSLDGKRHMLPYDTGVSVLFYNADYWQRAGLPNPRQLWLDKKWDWDAFLDAARRLTADDAGGRRYGIGTISHAPWAGGAFLWQNGADYADWAKNVQTFDRPDSVQAMQFQIDLAQRHRVMPSPSAAKTEGPTFQNGRLAMEMSFSFSRGTYMRLDGVKWDVAPLPRGKAGAAVHVARNGFGIATKSQQPEAAWLWLTHVTGKEVCTEATRQGRVHPPRKSVANTDVFLHPAGVTADFRPFVEQQPFGQFGAPHEKRGDLAGILQNPVMEAFDGQSSGQQLAAQLAPQIQQLLSQGKGFPDKK